MMPQTPKIFDITCKINTHTFMPTPNALFSNTVLQFEKFKDNDLLKSLVPNLAGVLPGDAIQYVPYEMGYVLLNQLEKLLGGPSVFKPFLKSYLDKYAFQSITTDVWMKYLYHYFSDKIEVTHFFI